MADEKWTAFFKPEGRKIHKTHYSVVNVSIQKDRTKLNGPSTLIISVPKVCGKAVLRNKLRRTIKEIYRRHNTLSGRNLWIQIKRNYKIERNLDFQHWEYALLKSVQKLSS